MKPIKINFLFTQLSSQKLHTGGDIRGLIIADFFKKNTNFKVSVTIPKISQKAFKNHTKIIIGKSYLEKIINKQTLLSSFIIFIISAVDFASISIERGFLCSVGSLLISSKNEVDPDGVLI